ncbi:PAS domain S-box protein [Pseudomonas sp. J452]|nr:PAS domain S-box protein [Pseudomonas sp. J452]UUY06489.1 PAS domain S-box protein [Pseudomonas sp. J452]
MLTLLLGLLLSALAAFFLAQHNQRESMAAVSAAAEQVADAVVRRLTLYQYGLRGARGSIVIASDSESGISRAKFQRYSQTRDIATEFPGARGFGFIRRVKPADEASFLAQARADGKADFAIRQLTPHEGERYVIQYLEPMAPNLAAIGLDIASEANRREAALAALQSGEVRLTGPITLVQAVGKPLQSFLILMPIYQSAQTPATQAEREATAIGWSYAPLLTEEVLVGLLPNSDASHVSLSDITATGSAAPFYSSEEPESGEDEEVSAQVERSVFGRRWQIEFSAHHPFIRALNQSSPRLLLIGGGLFSLLLASLVGLFSVSRQRQRLVVAEQAKLAAIVESSADGIIGKTLEGVVTSWNQGAEQLFGYRAEEALGRRLAELVVPAERHSEEVDILARLTRGERVMSFDTQRLHKDGHTLAVSVTVSPILNGQGQVVGASKTVRDISAQKAAEAQIRALNNSLEDQVVARTRELDELNVLLGSVLRAASEVSIIASDAEGIIRVFNSGAEHLLGYSADELLGRSTPAVLHVPEEVAARGRELSEEYAQPVEGFRVFVHKPELEGSETREWTYVRKDGTQFPVSLVVTAMRDDDGMVSGYLGIAVDITERKAAEQELAASVATMRAILRTAVNPVITLDVAGNVLSFNPAGEALFGYTREELFGQPLYQLTAEESRDELAGYLATINESSAPGSGSSKELTGLRQDGTVFPMQMSIGAMASAAQAQFVCIITDISELQRQRSELTTVRDQLLMAADVAELGIWSWNLADNALQWNERMYEMYGQPLSLRDEGLEYQHWYSRVHPEDVEAAASNLQAAVEGRGIYDAVFRVVRPDGSCCIVQAGAQIERDSQGVALRVTGINRDITSQRTLEASLRHAKEEADAASAAKSSFLANMSHEIRTPMNAVLGMLRLVQNTELNARQFDYVSKAESAGKALLGLLNDILDYSKIEAGKMRLDLHPFELEALMRELATILGGNQGDKDVEVIFDLDTDLPATLLGDSLRLQQVLINLAGNALKFTQHGQVVVRVEQVRRDADQVRLRIEVADSGIGISSEQLTQIFQGFTQAEASTTRRYGGTGLGLVISKRMVQLMGGELQVASVLGEGSRFWFEIDLSVVAAPELREEYSVIGRDLRLLIVDDNPVAGDLLQHTILDLGWQADLVRSGLEAIERVKQLADGRGYDVILMDWRMPDMDGLSAAKLLRQQGPVEHLPLVIMITAYGHEVLADACQEGNAPFSGFLTKPVTPRLLSETIQACLAGKLVLPGGQTQQPAANTLQPLLGLRLLVVEDNVLNRQVASELLQGEGALIEVAEGGLQGVRMATATPDAFDLVLMDIQMPDIDGFEATRRIRALPGFAQLPIVAMTANASQADKEACRASGMNDHVAKPIDLEKLIAVVLAQVGRALPPVEAVAMPVSEDVGLLEPTHTILARFGGNLQLICSVLANFGPQLHAQLDKLRSLTGFGDVAASGAVLHALKGSASTMGARALAARAAELEQLCSAEPQQAAALLADAGVVEELYRLLDASVALLGEQFPAMVNSVAAEVVAELDGTSLRELLREIINLLDAGNLEALGRVDALLEQTPHAQRSSFVCLSALVQSLDFAEASKAAKGLLETI